MKTKKHRLMPLIGVGITLALPVMTTISCSSSWTKWDSDGPQERPTTNFNHPRAQEEKLWKVREDEKLLLAWDEANATIDLTLLNNQYELITLLGLILNFSSPDQIDTYWNQPLEMQTYVNQVVRKMPENQNLKLVFNEQSESIGGIDLSSDIDKISDDIDYFLTLPKEKSENDPPETVYQDTYKAYNVEKNGLSPIGMPNDFFEVANVGAPLMSIDIVNMLTIEDSSFALQLSKLVNLPKEAFNGFKGIMEKVNTFLKSFFETNIFKAWIIDYQLDLNVQSNSFYYLNKIDKPLNHVYAQFLVLTLKKGN